MPAQQTQWSRGSLRRAGRHCSRIDDERVLNFVVMRAAATGTREPQSEQAKLAQRIGVRLESGLDCLTSAWTAKCQRPHVPPLADFLRIQSESDCMTYCVSLHLCLSATLGVGPSGFVADLQGRWSVMKETVQFFRELAKRHRQLAGELHNEESHSRPPPARR
jgi:hypothetical protein